MNVRWVLAAVGLSIALAGVSPAQEVTPQQQLAALSTVRWAGPPVTPDMLRNKTTLVLVYATWCPKCNDWSGELFQQLRQAAIDKPVVILAINADKSPAGVQQYLTARGFFAPNIFRGTPQNQTARKVIEFMETDDDFKREVAAKKAYDTAMQAVAANPRRRTPLLKSVAARFEGTHYGTLAADALTTGEPMPQ